MYHELSRSVSQRSRSQRDIMYQHNVHSDTYKLAKFKLKIIPEPSATRNAIFKVISEVKH